MNEIIESLYQRKSVRVYEDRAIPEEMKSHIFEMFYTGKTTVADSHRSLGLGLALCHSIIEAHNGTLILTDHAPHGCNFIFTLPLSEVTLNE